MTGSRIRRDPLNERAPLTVLDGDALERTGLTNLGDALQSLPVAGSAPNWQFNVPGNAGFPQDGASLGVPANLVQTNPQLSAVSAGNRSLDPETSEQLTAGIVFSSAPSADWIENLTLSADYYDLTIDDAIQGRTPSDVIAACVATLDPLFCGLVPRTADGVLGVIDNRLQNIGGIPFAAVCRGWFKPVPLPAMIRRASLGAVCLGVLAAPLAAQQTLTDPGQKSVRVVRTDTPPVIDGDLSDAVWASAAFIDDLHQTDPVEYAEPSEHTEIYVLYDDDALYVAARLYDSGRDQITANNMRQNDEIAEDDRFYVTIDPFNERRSGYYFGVNPNGVRGDGLYRNVSEFYSDWDSIYDAAAGRFEGGWTAEIEIPYKSISFDPTTDTWGLNFSRGIMRRDENIAWVSRNRQYNPSVSGLGVGFEGLEQGLGLDIVPSVSLTEVRTFSHDPLAEDRSKTSLEPTVDVFYKLTPQLNASLTANTDFSATDVDDRQVNLDRFGLFFPEKRDFFLRESDIFEFGGIGGQRQSQIPGLFALAQNGLPFFSRRIGLSPGGTPIDLEVGGKISGRVGRFELGALSVRQDAFGDIDARTLSVIRTRAGVLNESNLGVIVTEGNPGENLDNSLAGLDFSYRNTRLPGGRSLEADVWYQQSDTEGVDSDQAAFGFSVRLPTNDGFRAEFDYREYDANFNPALGFINRRNVSDAKLSLGYMVRPASGYLQSWLMHLDVEHVDQLDTGALQTHGLFIRPIVLRNRTGDEFSFGYRGLTEGIASPFEISPGIVIPVGQYQNGDWGGQFTTANHRKFAGHMRIVWTNDGTYFNGDRLDVNSELTWRPSARFRGSLVYSYSEIDLPQGSFETRLVAAGIDFAFTSTLSWVNLIQYDNVTETAGINMRLHWIPEAGREVYFVINHNVEDYDRDNRFRSTVSDMTVKVNYTFRF